MATPTFGGSAIFGYSVSMRTVNDPSDEQLNHFFGLAGSERLHGGLAGRVTMVSGVLRASNEANMLAGREAFRAYDDGVARTLTDTLGGSWASVVFRQFEPGDRVLRDSRGFYLPYRALFRHLV